MSSPTATLRPVEDVFRKEKVGHLCRTKHATAPADALLEDVLAILRGDSGGCVILVGEHGPQQGAAKPGSGGLAPVGIFTERDYLDKVVGKKIPAGTRVAELMTRAPRTLRLDQSLDDAMDLMTRGGYRHLPLVDYSGGLAGVLSVRDMIQYLAEFFPTEIMNQPHSSSGAASKREGE